MQEENHWQLIPMRDFSNLCVIKEDRGNIVATAQTQYAESIRSLPELIAASSELFQYLDGQYENWKEIRCFERLEQIIVRILRTSPQYDY